MGSLKGIYLSPFSPSSYKWIGFSLPLPSILLHSIPKKRLYSKGMCVLPFPLSLLNVCFFLLLPFLPLISWYLNIRQKGRSVPFIHKRSSDWILLFLVSPSFSSFPYKTQLFLLVCLISFLCFVSWCVLFLSYFSLTINLCSSDVFYCLLRFRDFRGASVAREAIVWR